MPSPDEIFSNWKGAVDNDFSAAISKTFDLDSPNVYVYRAESFAMTLSQIQRLIDSGDLKYKYQSHGKELDVTPADINAYTAIFSPSTDTSKALTSFVANAKKLSPRETVAQYLQSRRIAPPFKIPRSKTHVNPYYDFWTYSCQLITFLGPLPDASYADPLNAKRTHPMLPVFYHHFGCVVPTYEALSIISELAAESGAEGVIDMASGNGYWTYMLRRMKLDIIAVDNIASEYRTMWISDTVKSDGVEYLKRHDGGGRRILLMVYMVTAGTFTKRVIEAYHGDTIVVVGTQNENRYTGFRDSTVEEWFEKEMTAWQLVCRIAMPSFAGKDEGLFVWKRT